MEIFEVLNALGINFQILEHEAVFTVEQSRQLRIFEKIGARTVENLSKFGENTPASLGGGRFKIRQSQRAVTLIITSADVFFFLVDGKIHEKKSPTRSRGFFLFQ